MCNLSQGIREEGRTEERIDMNIKDVAAIVAGKVPSNV